MYLTSEKFPSPGGQGNDRYSPLITHSTLEVKGYLMKNFRRLKPSLKSFNHQPFDL